MHITENRKRPVVYERTGNMLLVILIALVFFQIQTASGVSPAENREALRIKPWSGDPRYWQYKGEPIILLGGTDQDNPFNHPNIGPAGLEAHLDLLVSVGGNYIRNTMSSRDRIDQESDLYNDNNLYPFFRDGETGLYDLGRWNDIYWDQFTDLLRMTAERDIIVQIEIWDRWDYGQVWGNAYSAEAWSAHPFNPMNNINYTEETTNLHKERWQGYPVFRTIPELDNAPNVLKYQEAFVNKLLAHTFKYHHILYCISNESTASEEWSRYWAKFILDKAAKAGVKIELTEMWNAHDLTDPMHRRTFDHPGLYSFVDVSQNNLRDGQVHWDNMQAARKMVAQPPRPMNNVKIYGGSALGGGIEEGTNKFWRNIIGGIAASRFHRPGPRYGFFSIGLSELAQTQIRSARMFLEAFDIFRATPDENSLLLSNREENEAYLSYTEGEQYAVYFPDGGSVTLDMAVATGSFQIKWLDIDNSRWTVRAAAGGGSETELNAPGKGQWLAVISLIDQGGSIKPYHKNPWYWEYRGEPIMLVGASDRDNLWQWTGDVLIKQLDLIKSVGGNYVRNTMSDRNEGDTFAPKEIKEGLYDLEQWNEEYWEKLRFFLDETEKRSIIVHLTLWDHFDLSGAGGYGRFAIHPLNPDNNINWEPGTIVNASDYYGGSLSTNNEPVLAYQRRYIDRLISISARYDHIFYNIANESKLSVEWDNYWATYIKDAARKHGSSIHVTTMLFDPGSSVRRVMSYRDIYSFAEVSQNNQDALGPVGKKHWENLLFWRKMIAMSDEGPMPINNVKVYGEGVGLNTAAGTEKEAVERFWRNIFGGAASTRFHRPAMRAGGIWGWGIGISERAQHTLLAVNMFLEEFDIFSAEPYEAFETVGNSVDSYCMADMGRAYAVYFPGGRATVHLDPWVHFERATVKWLDIASLTWSDEEIIEPEWNNFDGTDWWGPQRIITLAPRNHRSYVAIVKVVNADNHTEKQ